MKRYSNIELLRIISMLLIVMSHYSVHGGFVLDNSMSINKVILQFLRAGGNLGVDCFILITGYFMIKSTFKFDKLLKLLFAVFTYSASIYIISLLAGLIDFNLKQAVKSFFPVIFNQYWFVTSYILLYIFSPYINSLINAIDKEKHLDLVILLITIWSILPTILPVDLNFSSVGWFATLYIIAAYIRLYPNSWFENFKINKLLFLSSCFFILLFIIIFDIIGTKVSFFGNHAITLTGKTKIPLLFCAVTLFLWFKNIKMCYNRYINIFASSVFGVYLIHDNKIVRNLLWTDIFKNNSFFLSNYLIFHMVSSVSLIFLCSILIDQSRRFIIEKPFLKKIEGISGKYARRLQYLKLKFVAELMH